MRGPTPGAERWLEWGTASTMPGSRVRDADGRMIFTGSEVESLNIPEQRGEVVELKSPTAAVVKWSDDVRPAQACRLRVLADPPDLGRA